MTDVRKYNDSVVAIADRFAETVEQVEIVASIIDWCRDHGVEEKSPFRAGKCLRHITTKKFLILLAESVPDDEKQSIVEAMTLSGSTSEDIELLKNELRFVKHLVLHECAHALHPEFSEFECDTWAFRELKAEKV